MSAMVDDDTVDTVIELKCSGAVFFVLKVQFLYVKRQQSVLNPNSFISNLFYWFLQLSFLSGIILV